MVDGLVVSKLSYDTPGMKDFKCNKSDMSMESYLRDTALADQRKRRSTTYVWHDENGVLAGYVTIASHAGTSRRIPIRANHMMIPCRCWI